MALPARAERGTQLDEQDGQQDQPRTGQAEARESLVQHEVGGTCGEHGLQADDDGGFGRRRAAPLSAA